MVPVDEVPGQVDPLHVIARVHAAINDELRAKDSRRIDSSRLSQLTGSMERLLRAYEASARLVGRETLKQIVDLVEPHLPEDAASKLAELVEKAERRAGR